MAEDFITLLCIAPGYWYKELNLATSHTHIKPNRHGVIKLVSPSHLEFIPNLG